MGHVLHRATCCTSLSSSLRPGRVASAAHARVSSPTPHAYMYARPKKVERSSTLERSCRSDPFHSHAERDNDRSRGTRGYPRDRAQRRAATGVSARAERSGEFEHEFESRKRDEREAPLATTAQPTMHKPCKRRQRDSRHRSRDHRHIRLHRRETEHKMNMTPVTARTAQTV